MLVIFLIHHIDKGKEVIWLNRFANVETLDENVSHSLMKPITAEKSKHSISLLNLFTC